MIGASSIDSPRPSCQHCVNGDWLCQWEMAIFDPHRIHTPWPITKKIGTSDCVGNPYGCAKFGANPSMGGFWTNGWNITIFLFIYFYLFFINSPTGQTRRRILTLDGSSDADSRKDVPFGGFVDIAPHFGREIPPKTPIFGAWIGVFKPNGQNIESFMLSKLLHRFQPNFAQR